MKCPYCDGKGYYYQESSYGTERVQCNCQRVLTNEEWIKQANTEQLAEFMQTYTHDIIFDWKGLNNPFLSPFPLKNVIGNKCTTKGGWVEWLKQPHTFE